MKLIKGSDLFAMFDALHSLKSLARNHDPKTIEMVAKAIYDSYQFVRPWDHATTQRIHGGHTRRAATAAIAALAQSERAGA